MRMDEQEKERVRNEAKEKREKTSAVVTEKDVPPQTSPVTATPSSEATRPLQTDGPATAVDIDTATAAENIKQPELAHIAGDH